MVRTSGSKRVLRRGWTAALGVLALASGCEKDEAEQKTPEVAEQAQQAEQPQVSAEVLMQRAKSIFGELPEVAESEDNPVTEPKVELGRMLYYENRLSLGHDISCNSCHVLDEYGIDVREKAGEHGTSLGHEGQFGERNSPTVYNAAFHIAQFWDGRAEDVEEQATMPILNPVEMAMPSEVHVIKTLRSMPGYEEAFAEAFPEEEEPIRFENLGKAIGAFERKLVTPAPFDEFMGGDEEALNEKQLRGLQTFMDAGCVSCHNGPVVGGQLYQKMGLVKPYETEDPGRYKVTGKESDRGLFKVPSLRNVAKTGPYFHDGSIKTLEEAVQLMAEHQLARGRLSDQELENVVAFLETLTGEIPKDYIEKPELPESGPNTPKSAPTVAGKKDDEPTGGGEPAEAKTKDDEPAGGGAPAEAKTKNTPEK